MPDSRSELVLLIDAMARLHGRLREAFSSARAASALSDMEHTVLVAVVEAQRAPTVPQIGRSLGHPRQVIQRAANALQDAGLIATLPNPDHKRAALLVATERGTTMQSQANRKAEAIANELLQHIDPGQVRDATGLLGAIRSGLETYDRLAQTKRTTV